MFEKPNPLTVNRKQVGEISTTQNSRDSNAVYYIIWIAMREIAEKKAAKRIRNVTYTRIAASTHSEWVCGDWGRDKQNWEKKSQQPKNNIQALPAILLTRCIN